MNTLDQINYHSNQQQIGKAEIAYKIEEDEKTERKSVSGDWENKVI